MMHGKTVLPSAPTVKFHRNGLSQLTKFLLRNGLLSTAEPKLPVPVESIASPWRCKTISINNQTEGHSS